MKKSKEVIKTLIRTARSVGAADRIIVENYGFDTVEEKIAFVRGMFDVEATIDKQYTKDNQTYFSLLHEVIFS